MRDPLCQDGWTIVRNRAVAAGPDDKVTGGQFFTAHPPERDSGYNPPIRLYSLPQRPTHLITSRVLHFVIPVLVLVPRALVAVAISFSFRLSSGFFTLTNTRPVDRCRCTFLPL